jgi:hypothetical protein
MKQRKMAPIAKYHLFGIGPKRTRVKWGDKNDASYLRSQKHPAGVSAVSRKRAFVRFEPKQRLDPDQWI